MKKIILAVIVCIIAFGTFGCTKDKTQNQEKIKTYSLSQNYNKKAQNIASDFLKHKGKTVIKEDVHAFFYDLDNDNIDEIIFIVSTPNYRTRWGYNLYILKKEYFKYKDISTVLGVETNSNVEILNNKNDGYYDLKIHFENNTPLLVKYKKETGNYGFSTFHKMMK